MVPPTGPLNLDVEAISGICGSISIACWVVVFSPQIIENFRRGSADGLSLQFIIVWLAGDVFNILGAVLQGVLPTMIILAVYYTIADIVLLGQCFYYRGFTWRDDVIPPKPRTKKIQQAAAATGAAAAAAADNNSSSSSNGGANERTALLLKDNNNNNNNTTQAANLTRRADNGHSDHHHPSESRRHSYEHRERRGSNWSTLSPAVPFVPDMGSLDAASETDVSTALGSAAASSSPSTRRASTLQTVVFNALSMLMVCAAGVAGWYLSGGGSYREDNSGPPSDRPDGGDSDSSSSLAFNFWGQVFGYLCAVFYLGSRVPQLLLNWRRQSTDGVSMLFFLFACLGNLTYVLSIVAYDGCSGQNGVRGSVRGSGSDSDSCTPDDARAQYGRYLLVNLSWLAGSLGTLLLDMCIFVQFFIYRVEGDDDDSDDSDEDYDVEEQGSGATDVEADISGEDSNSNDDEQQRDERPLLRRNMSSYH